MKVGDLCVLAAQLPDEGLAVLLILLSYGVPLDAALDADTKDGSNDLRRKQRREGGSTNMLVPGNPGIQFEAKSTFGRDRGKF